jgi:signal transduction histidine kinase
MKEAPSVPNEASERLQRNIEKIMNLWLERADREVLAAHHQKQLALRDSLPEFLMQIANALSTVIDRTDARVKWDLEESERVGKKHGRERAGSRNYTMDQMIFEYHILRQVIWDVMEEDVPLSSIEMEIITCAIEQAVNDAATEFSSTLADIQEKLSATLAHDLRNPLTSIKLYAELLAARANDAAYVAKAAGRMAYSATRLDSMIRDLLDVCRLKAGEVIPLQLAECELDRIAKQVADEFDDLSERRFVFSSSGPTLGYWSVDGLRRVVENLATNAVKYGAPDTPVTVEVHQTSDRATLIVHNDGLPIPPEELGVLFQQYRRTRSAEEHIGWGVGLAVVKGVTEALHGTVHVESSEGSGTSFIIDLPKNRDVVRPVAPTATRG